MYEFKMKFCEMVRGASAYEVAARNGFEGTEAEWVAALEGGAKDAQTAAQQAAAEAQAAAGRAGKAADSAGENADAAAASAEAAALSAAMARSHAVTAETRAADAQQARADAIAAAGDAAAAKQAAQSAAVEAAEAGTKATQAAQSAAAEANRAFQIEQSIKQYESSAAASKTAAARSAADAARSAKAAKQSDWNAAEGEAGHVRNRTHWIEYSKVEILAGTTLTTTEDNIGDFEITQPLTLEVGKIYMVKWNGTEYTCTAQDMSSMQAGAVGLGNLTPMGLPGNGEPFAVVWMPGLCAAMEIGDEVHTEATIAIYDEAQEIIHQIDPKYIPDMYYTEGGMVEILPECQPILSENDGGFIVQQAITGVEDGKTYTVNWNGIEYECVAQGFDFDGMHLVTLGDIYTVTGGEIGTAATGEPFCVQIIPEDMVAVFGGGAMATPLAEITELTLSIKGNGETVHKLDNKYLDLAWLPTEEKIQCIEKQTIACEWPNSGSYGGIIRVPQIADGEKLIVVVDGKEFRCTAEVAPYMTQYYWIKIGNRALTESGEDTGEPFYIYGNSLDSYGFYHITAGTHTVEAYRSEPNKMPVEFLPDGVGSPYVVNVEMAADLSGGTADKTSTEIHQALANGKTVLAYCAGYIAPCIGSEDNRGAYFMVPMGSHSSNILTSFSALVLFCVNNDGSVVTGTIPTP